MKMEFTTIPELIRDVSSEFRDRTALQMRRGGRFFQVSFSELGSHMEDSAAGLASLGVQPGARLAILSENRPEWAISYLGVLRAACVSVPLCPQLKAPELRHILTLTESEYLFTSASHMDRALEIVEGLSFVKGIISMDDESDLTLSSLQIRGRDESATPSMPSESDLAALLFTSGTTGKAKGVMLSHKNIVSNVKSLCRALLLKPDDNLISVLPLYHTFESTCGMLAPLAEGASITYATSIKPREIIRDIRDSGATIILCVPLLYEKILAGIDRGVKKAGAFRRGFFKAAWSISKGLESVHIRPGKMFFSSVRKKAGLGSLRLMISGAAALSPEVGRALRTLGFSLIEGYGLTEASPVLTVNREGRERLGSVGQALDGIDLKICNPDEQGVGEITARGDNVMMGYFEAPEETAMVLKEGWLHTGDLGRIDTDGYLFITGRLKSVIVTKAGKNVYPEVIEEELMKSRFVKEALAVGRMDPESKREKVHAIVHPDYEIINKEASARGSRLSKDDIESLVREEVKKCNAALPDYRKIKEFEIREEEFPKTATGKIKRFEFQERSVAL
jgi:long-chain acyl-CoA synthetase